MFVRIAVTLTVMASALPATAQTRAYNNLRFEEDWSWLKDAEREDPFDRIKYIEFSDWANLSIGGEAQVRLEVWDGFGFNTANDDTYLLYRMFLHGDWKLGKHFRAFTQIKYSDLTDRDLPGGKRDALDRDQIDIWNMFAEVYGKVGDVELSARAGRQELQFGRQRLISPLDWSNNRRIFDAVRGTVAANGGDWSLDVFASSPVMIEGTEFNDWNDDSQFHGAYFTHKIGEKYSADAYGLYLRTDPIREDRVTLGARFAGKPTKQFEFDAEFAYQLGERGDADIRAWMLGTFAKYTFAANRWRPGISGGFEMGSGDSDPTGGDVRTFNQLFPLGHAYFGYIDVVGRQNAQDYHLGVSATTPTKVPVTLSADAHYFRLHKDGDALYNAGGGVVRAGDPSASQDVGWELDFTVALKPGKHHSILVGYSHFFPGEFVEDTGPSDNIDFFYTQYRFTF